MNTPSLLLATIVLPGLWGWLIGTVAHRAWKTRPATRPAQPTDSRRLTDYDI